MSTADVFNKLNSRDTRIFPTINTLTKTVFIILVAITITFFVKNTLAANNIIKQTQDAQIKSNNAEGWQLNSWNTNVVNVLTTLTGPIPFKQDGSVDIENFQVSGLLGTSTKAIASLYQPQASGVEYIAQVKDNFLGKSAYAQGVAFRTGNSLQPLLPLWKSLRNVVYILSSLFFIITGLMIMLRVKISPQAVIGVQNAIPKIITSLILVTFSYAIAGLIIDLSYWVQSLTIALLFSVKGVNFSENLFNNKWTSLNVVDLIPGQNWFNFQSLSNMNFAQLSMLANSTVPAFSLILLGGTIGQIVLGSIVGGLTGLLGSATGAIGTVVGGVAGGIVGVAGGLIFMIILFVVVAIWLIKLFFGLLKTYVSIIVQIVTGPLVIGLGALPNSKIGFSSWIIDLISKVAVFPVVLITLVFINYLIEISEGSLWVPSLLTYEVGSGGIVRAAIGLAGLAMLSKLPDLVPAAIFNLKPSPFGTAIGENLSKNPITDTGRTISSGISGGIKDGIGNLVQGNGWSGKGTKMAIDHNIKAGEKDENSNAMPK